MRRTLFVICIGVQLLLVSCAKDNCGCNLNGDTITFTEEDAKDAGVDLVTYCEGQDAAAKISNPDNSCSIE